MTTFVASEEENLLPTIGKTRHVVSIFLLIQLSIFGVISANLNPMVLTYAPHAEYSLTQATPHPQILIFGDSEFVDQATLEDWPGTGIEEDPYRIEGYSIFGVQAIGIVDTSVHFEIRNCYLDYDQPSVGGTNIVFWNVTNAVIADNVCSRNMIGLYIGDSSYNIIENNTCLGSSGSMTGIYLETDISTSDSNIVANNTCTGYEEGFFASLGCISNLIEWNVFDDNVFDVRDYNPTPVNNYTFNYYEDYMGIDANGDGFGDSEFSVEPYYTAEDPYPLMYRPDPPTWTEPPADQTNHYGGSLYYDLNATTYAPLSWHLNDTLFSVDNEGMVTSRVLLQVGVYGLDVTVTNIYGRYITDSFRVYVLDSTAPHWIITPIDQILQYNERLDYQLPVADPSGIDYWTLDDANHFTLSASFYFGGSTARITNTSILESRPYALNISVYDMYGNRLSVILIVTVLEAPLTIPTTTATISPTTSTTPVGVDPVMTFVLGAGIGGAVAIAIVIVFLRRKS